MNNTLGRLAKDARKHFRLLSALVFYGVCSYDAHAIPLSQITEIYFFGDSLSDSGFANATPSGFLPVGKAPTYTTYGGYTWAQHIAHDLAGYPLPVYPGPNPPDTITNNDFIAPVPDWVYPVLTGINYAAGGSTTNGQGVILTWAPSLLTQVDAYLLQAPSTLNPNAVYFIWSGSNDILGAIAQDPFPSFFQLLTISETVATNVAQAVAQLSMRGAKRIVVLSLPNMANIPLINLIFDGKQVLMKEVTFFCNSMINSHLGQVISQYGVHILYVDVYDLIDKIINATKAGQPYVVAGQSFLFVNATDPACEDNPLNALKCQSNYHPNYVFADVVHPTGEVHQVLSLEIETQLQAW